MNTRPLTVSVVAWVYIVVGFVGFAYHLTDFDGLPSLRNDWAAIEFVRLIAIVCGIFLLRGRNWARWTALAWIALHVVLSAFHQWPELVVHIVFCAVIAWMLFRPVASQYFGNTSGTADT